MTWNWFFRNHTIEVDDESFYKRVNSGELTDAEFDDAIKQRNAALVRTMSPERRIAIADDAARAELASQQRQRNREAEQRKQAEQAEARRVEAEQRFGQEIRNRFFAVNPHATQEMFAAEWPRLRSDAMAARMGQPPRSMEAEATNPRYNV